MSDIKRVRYFNGEFLVADDFNADQDYHRQMRYRHNKDFHALGIVTGLNVTSNPGEKFVTISPGLAVDKEGKEMILPGSGTVDFDTADYAAEGSYYITITWKEAESEPDENGNAKRYDETPDIAASTSPPSDPETDLILALVTLNVDKTINTIDRSGRKISAIEIGNDSVTSIKIAEADGTSGQLTGSGSGVKTGHIQDEAVTEAKLNAAAAAKLVTNGNTHDHSGGDGAQISHGSLNMDDGANPHGVAMSQLTDLNANNLNITNLATPAANTHAANKSYVDGKTGGTISSASNLTGVSTSHIRQVNASTSSTASNSYTQVNASYNCSATYYYSQANASYSCTVGGQRSQINASYNSTITSASVYGQINASYSSTVSGDRAQINASYNSTASALYSQINGSSSSTASGQYSRVNGSSNSTASGTYSQVNGSYSSTASGQNSQVSASELSTASATRSEVHASLRVIHPSSNSICGGYSSTGSASTANRKWLIYSSSGNVYIAGTVSSSFTFTDYGEYFENQKKGEIETGVLIALEGAKVRPAKKNEDFFGVVSATAGIRLGDTPFCWQGRYLVDEWGRQVFEEIKDPDWKPKKEPDKKWKPKKDQTEEDRPMIEVETEKDRPTIRVQKENPDYDPEKEQKPRSERPNEWTLVGMLGQVFVRCDKTVKPGDFVKSDNYGIGTKADEKTKLKAMKVTKEYDAKSGFAIVYCLLN